MKKNLILLLLFFISFSIEGKNNQLDSLLTILDKTIEKKSQYTQFKEVRIDSLKNSLSKQIKLDSIYNIYNKLYGEYRNYNMDSALAIANNKYTIAQKLHNTIYQNTSEMNIAEILGIMGMYKEAFDMVNSIDKRQFDNEQWRYYYHFNHSTYSLLYENSLSQKEKQHYGDLISQYKDSLLQVSDSNTLGYKLVKNGKLIELGQYNEALTLMNECYNENKDNESIIGTLTYGISDIYGKLEDTSREKKYLIVSATSDIKRAVKSYISLRKLAVLLYKEGDMNRAYTYIKCSLEDATFSKARFRTLEISETLPIIAATYDNNMMKEKSNLKKYLILISILSVILLVAIIFIYKQLTKLSEARKQVKNAYIEVKQMNEELKILNTKLLESNLVKEEYIGYVFNLCSTYIDKMDAYRIELDRKLKAGRIKEVMQITSSTSLVNDELKDFFRNFDAVFLNIYPNFVEEFNSLLLNGEQIYPKSGDLLTPELRVFALVRLGISESSKIATFLHYSPQTVYNYNLKVRNKLAVSREKFSVAIQQIGK